MPSIPAGIGRFASPLMPFLPLEGGVAGKLVAMGGEKPLPGTWHEGPDVLGGIFGLEAGTRCEEGVDLSKRLVWCVFCDSDAATLRGDA